MELVIPEDYKCYVTNTGQSKNFLIGDTGHDDEKLSIVGRQRCFVFNELEVWYAGGAFKMSPPLFHQVYAFMARRGFPCDVSCSITK